MISLLKAHCRPPINDHLHSRSLLNSHWTCSSEVTPSSSSPSFQNHEHQSSDRVEKRKRGRPRTRWMDKEEKRLKDFGVKRWNDMAAKIDQDSKSNTVERRLYESVGTGHRSIRDCSDNRKPNEFHAVYETGPYTNIENHYMRET
ncbi:hypothetical protein TNCV_4646201 [Trichonephila clavipes]|uniref:Uncharacterized protein n=1 Tax=Trichonephila clavipes TaxID=2585209 RepID=A0A8X6VMW5_TRICX|nr:hypothetical protein TNCV_4646201 [Trichonephila clavipes]